MSVASLRRVDVCGIVSALIVAVLVVCVCWKPTLHLTIASVVVPDTSQDSQLWLITQLGLYLVSILVWGLNRNASQYRRHASLYSVLLASVALLLPLFWSIAHIENVVSQFHSGVFRTAQLEGYFIKNDDIDGKATISALFLTRVTATKSLLLILAAIFFLATTLFFLYLSYGKRSGDYEVVSTKAPLYWQKITSISPLLALVLLIVGLVVIPVDSLENSAQTLFAYVIKYLVLLIFFLVILLVIRRIPHNNVVTGLFVLAALTVMSCTFLLQSFFLLQPWQQQRGIVSVGSFVLAGCLFFSTGIMLRRISPYQATTEEYVPFGDKKTYHR